MTSENVELELSPTWGSLKGHGEGISGWGGAETKAERWGSAWYKWKTEEDVRWA